MEVFKLPPSFPLNHYQPLLERLKGIALTSKIVHPYPSFRIVGESDSVFGSAQRLNWGGPEIRMDQVKNILGILLYRTRKGCSSHLASCARCAHRRRII